VLIIDDEADQASLNTRASRAGGSISPINERISELRNFFGKKYIPLGNGYAASAIFAESGLGKTASHGLRPKSTNTLKR
jgi:hypothetical protein